MSVRRRWKTAALLLPALGALGLALGAPPPPAQAALERPELGDVTWHRDLDAARALAKKTGRPLLVLFDEVPGCQTCVRYGQVVLREPLIVEAAETSFVPVAVFNNEGGADREWLKRFGEPAWNNPVVRIVDPGSLEPLAPRLSGDYSRRGLVETMKVALQKAGREVPGYLDLLATELSAVRTKTAHFSMYCFWSGEVCLGRLNGVVHTRAGFAEGKEVVEVRYDAARTSEAELERAAKACGEPLDTARFRFSPSDDKYQLRRSPLKKVDLTPLQQTRVNAALGEGEDPRPLLSPRQRAALR